MRIRKVFFFSYAIVSPLFSRVQCFPCGVNSILFISFWRIVCVCFFSRRPSRILSHQQSRGRGYGVSALVSIARNTLLCVYTGSVDIDLFHIHRKSDSSVHLSKAANAATRCECVRVFFCSACLVWCVLTSARLATR